MNIDKGIYLGEILRNFSLFPLENLSPFVRAFDVRKILTVVLAESAVKGNSWGGSFPGDTSAILPIRTSSLTEDQRPDEHELQILLFCTQP
jgi:hypothetical protein